MVNTKTYVCAALLSLAVLLSSSGSFADAKATYEETCASCHGSKGNGKGPLGATLSPRPADFTDAKRMKKRTDAQLFAVIKEGGLAGGLNASMAGYAGTLSDDQIKELVVYIRKFAK
jgi:mono/diheme cytochrome c family protein